MATSGTVYSGTHRLSYYGKWQFDWEVDNTYKVPGETKIKWDVTLTGRSTDSGGLYTVGTLYIDNVDSFTISNELVYYDDTNQKYNETDKKREDLGNTSGDFIVKHNSSGEGSFVVFFDISKIYTTYGVSPHPLKATHTITLDKNLPLSACEKPGRFSISAPHGVTTKAGIIAPGGIIECEWDQGIEGAGNAIAGYEIQYKVGTGEWVRADISGLTEDSDETSFNLPSNVSRGKIVSARIKTIGTVAGYDSDWTASSTTLTTNSLPQTPGVSYSSSIIGQNDVVFTLSRKQTGQVYAYKPPFGEINNLSANESSITLNNTNAQSGVYEFYIYDQLEYSAPAMVNVTTQTSDSIKLNPNVYSSGERVTIFSIINSDDETNTQEYIYGCTYDGRDYQINSTNSFSTVTFDVREKISSKELPLLSGTTHGYKIWCQVKTKQGVLSNRWYSNMYTFTIAACTLLNDEKQQAPFSQKIYIKEDYWKGSKIYLDGDFGGICNTDKSVNVAGFPYGNKITVLKMVENPDTNTQKTYYIKPINSLYKVYEPQFDIQPLYQSQEEGFKLYTDSNLVFYFGNIIGSDYAMSDHPILTIGYNNKKITSSKTDQSGADIAYYSFAGSDIYSLIRPNSTSSGGAPKNVNLTCTIKNDLGASFTKNLSIKINYAAEADIDKAYLKLVTDGGKETTLSNYILKEGLQIRCDTYVNHIGDQVQLSLQSSIDGINWTNLEATTELTKQNDEGNKDSTCYNTEYNKSKLIRVFQLGAFDFDGKVRLRACVASTTDGGAKAFSYYTSSRHYDVDGHATPSAYFSNVSVGDKITATCNIDFGCTYPDFANIVVVIPSSNEDSENIEISDTVELDTFSSPQEVTFSIKSDYSIDTTLQIAPQITVQRSLRTTGGVKLTQAQTIKTNAETLQSTLAYSAAPTVAYRPNHIGINTESFPTLDGILVINDYQKYKKIYLKGTAEANGTATQHTCIIDVSTGAIDGFTISGGEW